MAVLDSTRVREVVSVVLMARLVDRRGRIIGPDAIDSIEYSVYRIDEPRTGRIHEEVVCDGEQLHVPEVVSHRLHREPPWDADVSGFNFRHYFLIPSCTGRWTNGSRFEVRYVFTQMTGEETAVRFRIRATRND